MALGGRRTGQSAFADTAETDACPTAARVSCSDELEYRYGPAM